VPPPLVAHWLSWSLEPPRAGALTHAQVAIENAGAVEWAADIAASYHWLDDHGNPIVWDGLRTPFGRTVEPGGRVTVDLNVRAPIPPGPYRFSLDLVAEHRAWFSEIGDGGPETRIDVLPRIEGGRLADVARLHVPPSATPGPRWDERVLKLHAEGYAVVSGAVAAPRRLRRALAPWAPGPGRVPGFAQPLLCPSVLHGVELERLGDLQGLPAFRPPDEEPWVYDASLVLTLS
jgi:hypothetical protein